MTAAEFRTALASLELTQSEAARKMHVPRLKVWRWANSIYRIPGEVEALIQCWKRYKKRRKRRCLGCGEEGHTSPTCPQKGHAQ